MITKFINKLKKTDNYNFESKLSKSELISTIWYRFNQVFRGMFLKPFLSYRGLLFVGRNVTLKYMSSIKFGSNCIIEDGVTINALSNEGIIIGNNVSIGKDSILIGSGVIRNKGKGIIIKDNVGINARVYIGGQGGVFIGENVIMGPSVKILSENHIFIDKNIPIKDQGENRKGIIIENNCWIGANSIILDGVRIREGCVIAAGSVVTKSFSDNLVLGGIPAKILKKR